MSSARRSLLVAGVVVAALLVAVVANVSAPSPQVANAAPVPRSLKSVPRQIDLTEHLYCDDGMKGVKPIGDSEREREAKKTIRRAVRTVGGPNLCLVAAENLEMAVWWTTGVFGNGRDMDHWYKAHDAKSPDAWVFAYLGSTHSCPQRWEIRKVEVDGFTVRVVYGKPEESRWVPFFTCDIHPYFVWANLGKLPPGRYQFELIDADASNEVVVARKVNVTDE